jgi:hypothetical protein
MTSGNAGQPRVRGQLARERWSSSRLGPVGLGRIPDGEHFPCLTFLVCHKPAPEPWSARARGTCEAYKNRLVRQLEAYGPEGHLGAGPGRLIQFLTRASRSSAGCHLGPRRKQSCGRPGRQEDFRIEFGLFDGPAGGGRGRYRA